MTEEQGELFNKGDRGAYEISAEDEELFDGINLEAFGESLQTRDIKLTRYLEGQIEKVKGDGASAMFLEGLLKRAKSGTLALELQMENLKRRMPKA